jgi:hypothetical protein
MMAIAGLVWGLKLENRIDLLESRHRSDFDKLDDEIAAVEAATQKGILPIAEIKLHAMEVQINDIKKDIDVCLKSKR